VADRGARKAPQAFRLARARFEILIAARADDNRRAVRFFYPMSAGLECFDNGNSPLLSVRLVLMRRWLMRGLILFSLYRFLFHSD